MKEIKCPYCSSKMEVPEHYLGKEIKCVSCGARFEATDKPKISVDEMLKSQSKKEQKEKTKPKNKKHVLVVAAVLIVLVCSVVGFLLLSKPDPVKSFQYNILRKIQTEEKSPNIKGKEDVVITDIEYGVEETSSLISPYIASLDYEIRIYDDSDEAEEEWEGMAEREPSEKAKVELSFAFQDYEWVLRDIQAEVESTKYEGEIETKRLGGRLRLEMAQKMVNSGYNEGSRQVNELEDIASEIKSMDLVLTLKNITLRAVITEHAKKMFSDNIQGNEQ